MRGAKEHEQAAAINNINFVATFEVRTLSSVVQSNCIEECLLKEFSTRAIEEVPYHFDFRTLH